MRKLLSIALSTGFFLYSSVAPLAASAAIDNMLPSINGNPINGSVTTNGNNMNVEVNAAQNGTSIYNWDSFHVGANNTVNFQFNNHNQTALNKVNAAGGMSQIYGQLTNDGVGAATGKVFLLNPNGVFFGNGSSVNLNSFTVSSFEGKYNEETKTLELIKGANAGKISIQEGAKIHGDKGVNIVAPEVIVHKGSLISTSNIPNDADRTFGKVKIVTGDGVNFVYYNNGGTKELADNDVKVTADKNRVVINGTIESGNIDIRSASTHAESGIFVKNAVLKATKAVKGEDGNIFLTANNKVVVEDSTFTTDNQTVDANTVGTGKIAFLAGNKVSVNRSEFNTVGGGTADAGNVTFTTLYDGSETTVENSNITAAGDVKVKSNGIAAIQRSDVSGKNVEITGTKRGQATGSIITAANTITIKNTDGTGIGSWVNDSTLHADKIAMNAKETARIENSKLYANNVDVTAETGNVSVNDNSVINSKNGYGTFNIKAGNNIKTNSAMDIKNMQTNMEAGNDIDVKLTNADDREIGLSAKGNNVTLASEGTLSISSAIAKDTLFLDSQAVIAGKPYTSEGPVDEEGNPRSYMEAETFKSTADFEITNSFIPTEDGKFNQRHHIQYGANGEEKILLVTKYPTAPAPAPDPDPVPTPNPIPEPDPSLPNTSEYQEQATRVNRLPYPPEQASRVAPIADNRTNLVDVFAAAAQIEIVDDEE